MTETKTNHEVRDPIAWYTENESRVTLAKDLLEGTTAVRNGGYLRQWPQEGDSDHLERVSEAVLYNGFRKAIKGLTGKVFSKPIQHLDVKDPRANEIAEDIDLRGSTLNDYFRTVFEEGLAKGKHHSLVEMPPPVTDEDGNELELTQVEAEELGIRPYLVPYTWEDCIGWRYSVEGGAYRLRQVRLVERVVEDSGDWGTEVVERVRVLAPGTWELWLELEDEWKKGASGTTSLGFIPLETFYTNPTGFLQATPYLEDLAYLNVAHFQSSSDQRNILHIDRVAAYYALGFQDDEVDVDGVGPGVLFHSSDPNAKFGRVETNGKPAEIGEADLRNLELQMERLALEPLVKREGDQTATEKRIDAFEATSPLQTMAAGLERHINRVLDVMALYAGARPGDFGRVEVNRDFGDISAGDADDARVLLDACDRELLSRRTFWSELKRRRMLADDFDEEEEKNELLGESRGGGIEE